MKTLDGVIAANVRRIREEYGWSVASLAKEMGLEYHDVYGFEGRRIDRPQRPFRWSEIVALCAAFRMPLYRLVLPQPDELVDVETWIARGDPVDYDPDAPGPERFTSGRPGRREFGFLLFGVDGEQMTEDFFETLIATGAAEGGRRYEAAREIVEMVLAELDNREKEGS